MAAQIDATVVRRIADLAHLQLTEEEVGFYSQHLQKILTYVEQLNDVSVDGTSQEDQVTPERADVVVSSLPADVAVAQAKVAQGTSFRVPRIIE